MTKKKITITDFEEALERCIESVADGGRPEASDLMIVDKTIGWAGLERMKKDELSTYLFGVEAGYSIACGKWLSPLLLGDEEAL